MRTGVVKSEADGLRHKSYHPYLESNKQKVRDDEARARLDEELREQTTLEEVRLSIVTIQMLISRMLVLGWSI